MTRDRLIVDAQIHVWAAERADRPWIPGGSALAHRDEPLGAAEVVERMDAAGVDRAYVVGHGLEGVHNDVVLAAAGAFPERLRAIARFPIDDATAGADLLDRLAADSRVAGTRLVFNREAAGWLADGTADWYWQRASDEGVPTMVFAPGRSRELAAVAERYPRVRIAVCHFGVDTKLRDDAILESLEDTLALARFPNVAVKLTCAPSMTTQEYPYPFIVEQVRRAIDAFGPERAFWGSDLSRLRGSYPSARELFENELGLDLPELDLVMGRAILAWFPWRKEKA